MRYALLTKTMTLPQVFPERYFLATYAANPLIKRMTENWNGEPIALIEDVQGKI
jgi:hypothetical protein|tara:strand:- start:40254 stop:40415 length:162 start_codon:yes stop_codon:yes gene_type:complete